MNKPPAFQFYVDNFVEGTTELTDAECGLYMRLLCAQWTRGSLPNDDAELMRFSRGATTLELARVKNKFSVGDDGRLRNTRMELERQKQAAWREKSSIGGQKSAEKRKGGSKGGSTTPPTKRQHSSLQSPSPDNTEDSASRRLCVRPSVEEVKEAAKAIDLPESEAVRFWNYYESNGWKVGKNPMKSLNGALAGWKVRYEEKNGEKSPAYDPNQDWRNSL